MKFPKCILDEMQQKSSAKLEHIGNCGTVVALFLAGIIQTIMNVDFECILGEFIVMEALCIYMIIGYLKLGIAGRNFNPGIKTCFILSLIGAAANWIIIYLTMFLQGDTEGIFQEATLCSGITFAICLLGTILITWVTKKRRQKLDSGAEYQELAQMVGVTVQTLKAIEAGSYNPSIELCRAICKAKGKTLDELFGEDSVPLKFV